MTIGEYIRNRRMSLAAQDLLQPNSSIIDVAMQYQYDTQESFSKAFTVSRHTTIESTAGKG